MSEEIPVTEARSRFSELVNRVSYGKEQIVLTRHGRPLVALVPAEDLPELDEPAAAAAGATTVLDLSATKAGPGRADHTLAARAPEGPTA